MCRYVTYDRCSTLQTSLNYAVYILRWLGNFSLIFTSPTWRRATEDLCLRSFSKLNLMKILCSLMPVTSLDYSGPRTHPTQIHIKANWTEMQPSVTATPATLNQRYLHPKRPIRKGSARSFCTDYVTCWWPGRKTDHSLLSRVKIKNMFNYTFTPPYFFMAWCLELYSLVVATSITSFNITMFCVLPTECICANFMDFKKKNSDSFSIQH
jgi:hypothetical protein